MFGSDGAAAGASSLLHLKGCASQPGWRPGLVEVGGGNEQRPPPLKESRHRHRAVRECDLSE